MISSNVKLLRIIYISFYIFIFKKGTLTIFIILLKYNYLIIRVNNISAYA